MKNRVFTFLLLKVNGNKLTLTPTSGVILPVTLTRVSDSVINKYLN